MRVLTFAIIAFFLLFGVAIAYWDLPKTFFQQDEWWAFGIFIERMSKGGLFHFLTDIAVTSGKVHFNPATEFGLYLQYKLFGTIFLGYALVSIATHSINVILVYVLLQKLLKNTYLAVLSAALFGVNSISHQAVSWIATSLNTQMSTMFSLFFSLLFYHYMEQKKGNKVILYVALCCIVMALLFKETALPLVLFIYFLFIFPRAARMVSVRNITIPTVLVLSVFGLVRVLVYCLSPIVIGGVAGALTQPNFFVYLFRIFFLPFRVIVQSIFPQLFLLNVSKVLMILAYPQFILSDGSANPYITESVVLDYLCLILGVVVFLSTFAVWKIFKRSKEIDLATGVSFSIAFTIGGALAVIFIPGRPGFVSIIEPRHLYAGMIGVSTFLVLSMYGFFRYVLRLRFWKLGLILVTTSLIVFHIKAIESDIQKLTQISVLRKSFLAKVKNNYPTLPKEVVFYTQSDRPYYGMAEDVKILPLQSGFGRMLMVWYQDKENFSGCLYEKAFLHGIKEEGYRSCSGRGVGYYRQYQTLLASLRQYNLSPDIVIAYNWNSKKGEFSDITREIRTKLLTDLPYESIK